MYFKMSEDKIIVNNMTSLFGIDFFFFAWMIWIQYERLNKTL